MDLNGLSRLNSLTTLELGVNKTIDDCELSVLSSLTQLQHLKLVSSSENVEALKYLTNLEILDLNAPVESTTLFRHLVNLHTITLNNFGGDDDSWISDIESFCTKLVVFELVQCKYSPQSLSNFKTKRPNVNIYSTNNVHKVM